MRIARLISMGLWGMWLTCQPALCGGDATAKWVDLSKGVRRIRLENAHLQMDFNPQAGARGATLIDKATGKDWLFGQESQEGSGLFMDHFWEQNWPGEFLNVPYQAEILPSSNGEASARFSVTATGKWGSAPPQPLLAGLLLTRTVTLMPDSPVINVAVQIHNPTQDSKLMGYWMQNVLWAAGDKENDRYLRPNARGISRVGWNWSTKTVISDYIESDFERAPMDGWTAVLDEKQGRGMVFKMAYGPLMFLYNCLQGSTVEWQYLQVAIPPGKSWQTEVKAALFGDLFHLNHVSADALFGTEFRIRPAALDISLQAVRLDRPVRTVRFDLRVLKLVSREEVPLPSAEIRNLKSTPKQATVRMPGPFKEQIVLRVDALVTRDDGTEKKEHFEVFYGGALGFAGLNRTIDPSPMYPIPPQPKELVFLKPDKIERLRQATPKVLLINGLAWQAKAAAAAIPAEVKESATAGASSIAANLTYWPVEYAELMSYDAVVMADVDADAMGLLGQEMLKDYVLNGGGLVILGGFNTLGNGHFAQARFADILPVEPGKPFEIQPLAVKTLTATGEPDMKGMEGKVVNYAHLLALRPAARAIVSAGDRPIIVAGNAGKGRIVVIGATMLGTVPPGSTALWKADDWPQQLATLIRWAADR